MLLNINDYFETNYGTITIKSFIGGGGQGEVYKVLLDNHYYALKWYDDSKITEKHRNSLYHLSKIESPNDSFIWPKLIIETEEGFGYLMEFIDTTIYQSLNDWVLRNYVMDISLLIKACFYLVNSYHKLHSMGLSYQDISLNNIFMNNKNGEILIVDNDNIITNGQSSSGILGTTEFMAPEIIIGEKEIPNTDTDRYSLAILLFHLLMVGHPFNGQLEANIKCMDIPAKTKLYGTNPIFVFDPNNNSNRPVKGIHDGVVALWNIYPNYIKELFIQAFTKGITNNSERPRESQWRTAFAKFEASIYKCPYCNQTEIIYDLDTIKQKKIQVCNYCKNKPLVPRIKIQDYIIACSNGKTIKKLHIDKKNDFDFKSIVATIYWDNETLQIENQSSQNITVNTMLNEIKNCGISQKIELHHGDTIYIDGSIAKVRF